MCTLSNGLVGADIFLLKVDRNVQLCYREESEKEKKEKAHLCRKHLTRLKKSPSLYLCPFVRASSYALSILLLETSRFDYEYEFG